MCIIIFLKVVSESCIFNLKRVKLHGATFRE